MQGLSLAPVREIALIKAYCLGRRVAFRDYLDIYFLLQRGLVTLDYILTNAPRKFTIEGENLFSGRLFLEQLVFFVDIPDREAALDMLQDRSLTVKEVQRFLSEKAREVLARVGERGNGR